MYKLSIIIPVYNRPKLLEETLRSLEGIKKHIEIIVIDDGSKKINAKVQEKLSLEYNTKYFFQKNKGLSEARNFGIEKSRGEFLFFLDSDDILKKTFISFLNNSYDKWSKYNVSRYNISTFDGPLIEVEKWKPKKIFKKDHTSQCSSYIIKKSFLLEHNLFFKGKLFEDNLWVFNIKKNIKINQMKFFNIYSIWYRATYDKEKLTTKTKIYFDDVKHFFSTEIYENDNSYAKLTLMIINSIFNKIKSDFEWYKSNYDLIKNIILFLKFISNNNKIIKNKKQFEKLYKFFINI